MSLLFIMIGLLLIFGQESIRWMLGIVALISFGVCFIGLVALFSPIVALFVAGFICLIIIAAIIDIIDGGKSTYKGC